MSPRTTFKACGHMPKLLPRNVLRHPAATAIRFGAKVLEIKAAVVGVPGRSTRVPQGGSDWRA